MKWQQHLILFLVALVAGTGTAFVTVDLLFPEEEPSIATDDTPQRDNVVLISIDTLRPDHLTLYGYPRETRPEIDAFFRDSEIWQNAYATEASTAPSVVSLLTGRLPQNHGVRLFYKHLGENVPTLADILKTQPTHSATSTATTKKLHTWTARSDVFSKATKPRTLSKIQSLFSQQITARP